MILAMSSAGGPQALAQVRRIVASSGLPLMQARKFNGILNAMEMQIEDGEYSLEVVEHLGKAVLALAKGYRLDVTKVDRALTSVYQCLKI
jgi:hypothetical protein